MIAAPWIQAQHRPALLLCVAAVFIHLFCDMLAGGINPFPPFSRPIGDYYLPPQYWMWLDLAAVMLAFILWLMTRQLLAEQRPAHR